ncbi:hypothetical protein ACKWTF_008189 [Chironomus riparius]
MYRNVLFFPTVLLLRVFSRFLKLAAHVSNKKYISSISESIEHPRKNPRTPPTSATTFMQFIGCIFLIFYNFKVIKHKIYSRNRSTRIMCKCKSFNYREEIQ